MVPVKEEIHLLLLPALLLKFVDTLVGQKFPGVLLIQIVEQMVVFVVIKVQLTTAAMVIALRAEMGLVMLVVYKERLLAVVQK